ncbi:MAG: molybdopterin-dependent oxidoreductase [bacterium]
MSAEVMVTFQVNGRQHTLAMLPARTLLKILREDLGLTGTKCGCEAGDCGACTVLINGRSLSSCLVLAATLDGAEITTIEGLAPGGELHPLQKAFIKHGAMQCGFCTPGALLSAKALIDRKPAPGRDDILAALGANLCRCGTYPRIISAIQDWQNCQDEPVHTHPPDAERIQPRDHSVVGHGVARYDATEKVTGQTRFTDDITLPGLLHGKLLHSPIAHGLIKKIDTSRAEALPGVLAVITGADVTDKYYGVSPARYDEHILAKDRVRYVGDEVAAVAAVDEETASRAVDLIEVEYEELPAVFDPVAAMAPDAPVIHPENPKFANNINAQVEWHFGDVEKGFAEADHVRQQTFVGNRTYQSPIEPHAAIARWERHGERLTVWSSAQTPHYIHHQLARMFEIPMSNIRFIKPPVGGGFGVKAETTPLELCSVILARKTGRPVKMKYTREEMFYHFRGRHKQYIDLKIGVKQDGAITAVQSTIHLDGGAYTSFGIVTVYYAGSMVPTLYKLPNYKYDGYRLYTNLPASGAMRGHGVPQPRFAFEQLLDMIAEDLNLDPLAVRQLNAMEPNSTTCNELDISSCELQATLEQARVETGWDEKYGKLPPGKGIGISCGGFVSGAGYPIYRSDFPHSNAVIRVLEDGRGIALHIAAADIGQGCNTVLPQIAAEELGVPYAWIWMAECDSLLSPVELGAYASRITLMGGNAVRMAAAEVKAQLLQVAGERLGCDPHGLVARDGRIYVPEQPDFGLDWDEVARLAFSRSGPVVGKGHYRPRKGLGGAYKGGPVGTSPAYSFSTTVAEVTVDLETGYVTVDKFHDFSDAGTVINPITFHGQVEGSVVMEVGEALMEDTIHDHRGVLLNPDLHGYLIASIYETPEINSRAVDSYEPHGPFGAKEIGEGSTVPMMAAIANAITDACGVRVTELPITPEKILRGLRELHRG